MHSRVKATIRQTKNGWIVDLTDRVTNYSYQVPHSPLDTQEAALAFARKHKAAVVVVDQMEAE